MTFHRPNGTSLHGPQGVDDLPGDVAKAGCRTGLQPPPPLVGLALRLGEGLQPVE